MSGGRIGGADLDGVFRRLEPPPGGRAALRRRLAEERRPSSSKISGRSRILAATAALLVALAGVYRVAIHRPAGGLDFPESSRPLRMSLGLVSPATEVARTPASEAGRQALLEIPVEREGVTLYWLGSLPGSAP